MPCRCCKTLILKFPFFVNAVLVFGVSFPIVLNGLWSVKLEPYLSKQVLSYSLVLSLILTELAVAISLQPEHQHR